MPLLMLRDLDDFSKVFSKELNSIKTSLELLRVLPVATTTTPAMMHVFEPLVEGLDRKVLVLHRFHHRDLTLGSH